jgi:hypothetical protein
MSRIAVTGNPLGTGTFTITSPNSNSDRTLNLPDASGTVDAFPTGTKMLFQQTAAPTGWTKDTSHDNKALRVVSGTASTGGSVAFTTAFASQAVSGSIGNTTLTTAQMPSHAHNRGVTTNSGSPANPGAFWGVNVFYTNSGSGFTSDSAGTSPEGGGGSHNHSFTGTAINLAVSYVDLIIATKN